jgi:hypothetical protein
MPLPSTLDPWREKGIPLDEQIRSWKQLTKEPYHKLDVDAYSRARVILMNGVEAEAWAYGHAFHRMTDNRELQALLARLAEQADQGPLRSALGRAVAEVEHQEDEHLQWARRMHAQLALGMGTTGPAPSPARWQGRISTPEVPLGAEHPRPMGEGLLEHASDPQWQPSEIVRSLELGMRSDGRAGR